MAQAGQASILWVARPIWVAPATSLAVPAAWPAWLMLAAGLYLIVRQ